VSRSANINVVALVSNVTWHTFHNFHYTRYAAANSHVRLHNGCICWRTFAL